MGKVCALARSVSCEGSVSDEESASYEKRRALLTKRREQLSKGKTHEQQTPKIETDLDSLAINTGSFIFRLCW